MVSLFLLKICTYFTKREKVNNTKKKKPKFDKLLMRKYSFFEYFFNFLTSSMSGNNTAEFEKLLTDPPLLEVHEDEQKRFDALMKNMKIGEESVVVLSGSRCGPCQAMRWKPWSGNSTDRLAQRSEQLKPTPSQVWYLESAGKNNWDTDNETLVTIKKLLPANETIAYPSWFILKRTSETERVANSYWIGERSIQWLISTQTEKYNQSKEVAPSHEKAALELFKERLLDKENTEEELSLLGLHLDVTQQADRTNLINQLLKAQEVGNQSLSAEDISAYTNNLLWFGEHLTTLPTTTAIPANLITSIRNKEDLTALGVNEADKNWLQDALEIATITLATEAIGPIYALLLEQTYPERRTTWFDATTIENECKKVVISSPSDLEKLINSKGIALSPATKALLTQLAYPTNPLTTALAGAEFASIVETTKAGFLHLAKTYVPVPEKVEWDEKRLTVDNSQTEWLQELTLGPWPELSRGEPVQIALPPFTETASEQEVPEDRDAWKIDALIGEMTDAEAKKAYEISIQQQIQEQIQKIKQQVEKMQKEKAPERSAEFEAWWTENQLESKLTSSYITVFTEVYARDEFTKTLIQAGEEIKTLITTNSLALPLKKSAVQEILHKKVEQAMVTPEKTARIQQRLQEEIEKIQLTIQSSDTQKDVVEKTPTDLPPRLRWTTGTVSSTNSSSYIPQGVISSTDSRSSSLPVWAYALPESTPKTVALAAAPHSGNWLVGIFAWLGIVFWTLYLANKADSPPAEGAEAWWSFWGKMGKMWLIWLALAWWAYGSYRAYDYFVNGKKWGNAQGWWTNVSNGAESTTTAPLYPIPNGQIETTAGTQTNSVSWNETWNIESNNTQTRTEEEQSSDWWTTSPWAENGENKKNDDATNTASDTENAPVPETTVLPKTIPWPETGTILNEAQQEALAEANKDTIAELSAKKTALDGTKKIEEVLEGEHGKRVAKMYNDIVTHTWLKLNNNKEKKRKAGDTVCIIDPERNPKVMYLIEDGVIKWALPITPGKNGIGNENGSEKTSTGIMLFSPSEITGTSTDTANADVLGNTSKKDNEWKEYNKAWCDYRPGDRAHHQITWRRMPLYGLEEKNHNAYARGIYCHGTNNPQELGYATSQGCIRISNADAIQLADYIKAQTKNKKQVFLGVIE